MKRTYQPDEDRDEIYVNGKPWPYHSDIPGYKERDPRPFVTIGCLIGAIGGVLLTFFKLVPDLFLVFRILASVGCGVVGYFVGGFLGVGYIEFEKETYRNIQNDPSGIWIFVGIGIAGLIAILIMLLCS